MSQNNRKGPIELTINDLQIGVTQSGSLDLNQNLCSAKAFELNGLNAEFLTRLVQNCGLEIHQRLLRSDFVYALSIFMHHLLLHLRVSPRNDFSECSNPIRELCPKQTNRPVTSKNHPFRPKHIKTMVDGRCQSLCIPACLGSSHNT